MKSSSLRMIDAGIANPREYRDSLIHDWEIRQDYVQHLSTYVLRETTPALFFFHLRDGELKVQNRSYSVTWANSPDKVREAQVILVSLRYCKHLDRGYCIVKVLQGDGQFDVLEY